VQVLKLNREDMRAAQSISKEDSGAVTDGDGSIQLDMMGPSEMNMI
jgi:hypothetical protein